MSTAVAPVETRHAEPDLIDRIAQALPEEVRAEYYRELLHCRSLPESDEMLRILRAMQFLVLLIEQAPSRVAEERERFDTLLAVAMANMAGINAASESYHIALEGKLKALPAEVAEGIGPAAVAEKINENLRKEFVRSGIPATAEALGLVSRQILNVGSEFTATAENITHSYRGAAVDAREAIAAMKLEIAQSTEAATRFTKQVSDTFSKAHRWMLVMFAGGALVIGLAAGMMLERSLISLPEPVAVEKAPVVQPAQPSAEEIAAPRKTSEPRP